MKRKRGKWLAALLAAALMTAMLPAAVFAEPSGEQTESSVAKVGDTYYDSLAKAFEAVKTEGTIELVADAQLSTRVLIAAGKNITLDLGSYTVKSDGSFFVGYSMVFENRGTFTVKGEGRIEAVTGANPYIGIENSGGTLNVLSGNIVGSKYGIRNVKSGSLKISGGTVANQGTASDGQDCAVYAQGGTTVISGNAALNGYSAAVRSYGAAVTVSENAYLDGQFGVMLFNNPAENTEAAAHSAFKMTGGTVNAERGFALSGNNTQSALSSAEITGGTLKTVDEATAIYWPMEGDLTVGGSAVIEGGTGIEAKMGTISITGGTITGTGAYLADEPLSGGSQSEGSALLVASQMYGANEGQYIESPALTVTITGGSLSGRQGNAVTVYNTEDTEAQKTEVSVSGGTLNAAPGRAGVHVVNASGQNQAELKQEDGVNSFVSSQSQTSVAVSAGAVSAAVNKGGSTSYYADVNEALAENTESTDPVDIYILSNSEVGSEALKSENVKIITANGVELEVESNVDGMKVIETVNDDGSKTYALAKAYETVYVDGVFGNDANSGADADKAVKTLEKALEMAADDGTIYICGTVTVNSSLTIDGAKIERADGFTGTLITVTGTATEMTLSNTAIDGKKVNNTVGNLINVTRDAALNIEEGAKLINNNETAVQVGANSTLNMNGGEISGNTASVWGGALMNYGTAHLNGGEIKDNAAPQGGAGVITFDGAVTILDGASITGNRSGSYGGGVYVYGYSGTSSSAVFEMKNGSITGNTSEITGAGIFGYVYDKGQVEIKISGGTIKDNISTDEGMGHAIGLYGEQGSIAYPTLELSGSPEIRGDIFYQNDYEDGYVIHVTGEFTPVNSVEINRSNNILGIPAVEYANGITPNLADFVSGNMGDGFKIEGQNLIWAKASFVYFYDEDGTEFKENRHGVVIGETIDLADIPTPVKEGYTLDGWYEENSTEPWDFATDAVSETFTRLYARWSFNAPDVAVLADVENPHIGTDAVLTAVVTHELDHLTYTYQWYKDGEPLTGESESKLTVSESGAYTVKVTASNGNETSSEVESAPVEITVDGHVYVSVVTKPTCTEQGYTTHTCEICGDSYVDSYIDANGHTFPAEWKSDANRHWKECTVCGARNSEAAHAFKWVIDKEAAAAEDGSKHEECAVCGYAKEAVKIPAASSSNTGSTSENNQTSSTAPSTGDDKNIILWSTLWALSCAGLIGIAVYSRKRGYSK